MDVTGIPFNKHLGILSGGNGSLTLGESEALTNHLGTFHAGAQFALAEAASGMLLLERFHDLADKVVPVLRSSEIKFKRPASGDIHAVASVSDERSEKFLEQFNKKKRAVITVSVDVKDLEGTVTAMAKYDWFVTALD